MIEKALIPIAGLGTRLRPVTAVLPKAMFPLVDAHGRLRTVAHMILAEAAASGVAQAALIVSPGQQEIIERYLAAARAHADDAGLPEQVEYILQPEPAGFGEAVLRGREFVGSAEAFLLLLGDHVHLEDAGCDPCARQVADAFAHYGGAAMIGMQPVGVDQLSLVGTAAGAPVGERVYRCTDFVEKPDPETARRRLVTDGLAEETYLAHCGIYLFTPEIFDCLSDLAASAREGREVQLADAQAMLLRRRPDEYYLLRIAGRALDTGTPEGYAATQAALVEARRRPGA